MRVERELRGEVVIQGVKRQATRGCSAADPSLVQENLRWVLFELGSLFSWLGTGVFEAVAWESFSMFRMAGRCGCWAV